MSKFYPLLVAKVHQETRDCIVVTFDVPPELSDTFRYQQGQYLTLRTEIEAESVRRSYSICSAVQDETLRVAIKLSTCGLFSTWANANLKAGMVIDVMPPMGNFNVVLEPAQCKHYIAFAAGSGITPILSIIKTTLLTEQSSHYTLVYGNRASSSVIFKEELADLKDRYTERLNIVYVMSREQQDIKLFNGRIDRDKASQVLKQWARTVDYDTAFICGPEDMMQGVAAALLAEGMPKSSIKMELFAAAAPRAGHPSRINNARTAGITEVTLIQDGNHTTFTMKQELESLLEAGLRAGIDMRYSCKGGVCSTCRCKVLEGKVEMDVNYALEDYEIARGFVLGCQSFAVTDTLVVDFDQHE